METKFNLVKRTFSDVYGQGYSPKEYKGPQYTQTITPNENYVYVHDCVFSYCSSSSNGGALNCGDTIYKLLVEQTTFISCSTSTSNGGGIYFKSQTNGESVLSKICGFNCSSTSTGPFAYVYTKNDITYKNYVNDSSVTHSSKNSTSAYHAVRLNYGNILCPSVNLTNNEGYYHVALYTYPTTGSGSPASNTCRISYSSIVNNTANGGWSCMELCNSASSQCIDTCNVINNKQTVYSSYEITFYTNTNVLIKDSCILGNNKGYDVFYAEGSSAKITVSNCTIDDDIISNSRYSGTVIFTKMIEKSFIHALSHISTQKCDSYFDSYGTLTAQPIVSSQSKNSRYFMSCIYKHPMIDPFMITKLITLLAMLPLDPSNDYYFDSNYYLYVGFVNN